MEVLPAALICKNNLLGRWLSSSPHTIFPSVICFITTIINVELLFVNMPYQLSMWQIDNVQSSIGNRKFVQLPPKSSFSSVRKEIISLLLRRLFFHHRVSHAKLPPFDSELPEMPDYIFNPLRSSG